MEWAKCVIPLVSSGRVKVFGRSIDAPKNLYMMQEILLYVRWVKHQSILPLVFDCLSNLEGLKLVACSFYVHNSVFVVEGDMSSWKLDAPMNIDTTTHPLLSLFQLLSVNPSQEVINTCQCDSLFSSLVEPTLITWENLSHLTRLSLDQKNSILGSTC